MDPRATESPREEIEITPEMMEAGASIIADFFEQPRDWLMEELARRIYEGMVSASAFSASSLRSSSSIDISSMRYPAEKMRPRNSKV